jgi:hypothetical protein
MNSDISNQNATGSQQQTSLIPDFISSRPDGLYINLSKLHSTDIFEAFVSRIFSENFLFSELNYDAFFKLLYDNDWLLSVQNKLANLKIAAGIVQIPPNRLSLYKTVKVLERGKQAEYVFEPVNIEVSIEHPGEAGVATAVPQKSNLVLQPATLDFDEFVAVMWAKGIRYGINAEEVRKVIASRAATRMIVANYLAPTEGKDADILEVCPDLHRDNSPKTLLNGKADMRAFKNRFPHIAKGAPLLKKIPRVLGKHGYKVTGEIIEPAVPKDLNLLALASTGTTARMEPDGDYLVAEMDGFLNIDPVYNTISITEKIETTAGVSMKTTGDLMLNVEEFVEHGEVQEGRVVKGRHMTFKSNVFGKLMSSSGNIIVEGNLTGGGAETTDGNITLGRASRSIVRTLKGEVTAKYCENCSIIGRKINVEHAVNCELIGDEIYAEKIEGCMLAARSIKVISSTESKSRESLITMFIPDLSEFDKNIAALQKKISDCQKTIAIKNAEIGQFKSDQDFAKFLGLYDRIKTGEIKLTSEQAGNWQKLMTRHAKAFSLVETANKQILALERLCDESEEEIKGINQNRETAGTGISCTIDNIAGQTTGQTMISPYGMQLFKDMSDTEIKIVLQKVDVQKTKIFSEDDGSINWNYK